MRIYIKAEIAAAAMAIAVVGTSSSRAALPAYDHVVVVVEENHSMTQIIGNSVDAPYINSLAAGGTSFTNFFAITHPSQPNYLQFFSGSNQGVFDNSFPGSAPFSTPNLGAALRAAQGASAFGGYAEDLPAVGSNVSTSGAYARKHNPWVNWQGNGVNQLPASVNMPFSSFPSDFSLLPKVSLVVPNLQNDMHDGTVKMGDDWLAANIGAYASWAKSHNSLLIVTWDEDARQAQNHIPTIFYGAGVRAGHVSADTWTLHHLLRTLGDLYGAAPSGTAADMPAISGAFANEVPNVVRRFRNGDANGYAGTTDTYLDQTQPGVAFSTAGTIRVDGDVDNDPLNGAQVTQALIRFDDVFGSGANQIPLGTPIRSAKLVLSTGAGASDVSNDAISLRQIRVSWNANDTWAGSFGGDGVDADDVEADADASFALIPNVNDAGPTPAIFDVTSAVNAWSSGGDNHGWVLTPPAGGIDGWNWLSSESANVAARPYLEISVAADLGDSDLDGDVDLSDLGNLATSYGTTSGATWSHGDFDGDGDVDLNDLGALATHYGAGTAQAFADFQSLASIPEPRTGIALVLLAGAIVSHRTQRRGNGREIAFPTRCAAAP